MTKGILERLAEGPVLGDGGYLLELERRGYVQAGPFTPEVVIEHPDALAQLHLEFLLAGAEVLQTMTFYASDDKLATVGLAGKVDEINRDAVRIALEVAREGDAPGECAARLAGAGADVVGVNCLNGPEQQIRIAREMRAATTGHVAAQPVAYRTSDERPDFTSFEAFPTALDPMQLPRADMA